MDQKTSDEKELFEEPPLEDFLNDEEFDEKEDFRRKTRGKWIKVAAGTLAIVLLINMLSVWVNVINIPALDFVKTSIRLSKIESIQLSKEAVVTIEGDGTKGTGFNIREDGLIVTNSHVVAEISPITVYFSDGNVFQGKIVADDPELDIALVEIKGKDLPVLSLQEDADFKVNDPVYVIGNPLSFTQIANEGLIEGMTYVINRSVPVLQISAPVYRGNSGSPVLDKDFRVIGVVYATTVPKVGSGTRSSGLVIPIESIFGLLNDSIYKE
jgi:serine protease Do